jgi:ankyrin
MQNLKRKRNYVPRTEAEIKADLLRRIAPFAEWTRKKKPLHTACIYGYADVIEELLTAGSEIEARDSLGRGALHWACSLICHSSADPWPRDYCKAVWILLLKNANVNAIDKDGNTPLHLAARFSSYEIVCSLLSAGARHDIRNNDGETPLWDSCRKGDIMAVSMLLNNGARADIEDKEGYDLLYVVCKIQSHPDIVPLLLSHGATGKTKFHNGEFDSCLHLCCYYSFALTLSQLLTQENINVNSVDLCLNTPLHLACRQGHIGMVNTLLLKNADVSALNNQSNTPLYLACKSGQLEVVSALLAKGASVNSQNSRGKTPLFITITEKPEIATMLLAHGADPNVKDCEGVSPLQRVCKKGHDSRIPLLLNAGARLDDIDDTGRTALYHACVVGLPTTVSILLQNGANLDCLLPAGRLHPKVTSYLLKAGAKLENLEYSSLELACLKGDTAIIRQEASKEKMTWMFESVVYKLGNISVLIAFVAFVNLSTSNITLDIHLAPSTFEWNGIFFSFFPIRKTHFF